MVDYLGNTDGGNAYGAGDSSATDAAQPGSADVYEYKIDTAPAASLNK